MNEALSGLSNPFPSKDIEWRIAQVGKGSDGKIWAKVLAYVTARAIMERLDDVCGPDGWRDEYREWHGDKAQLCGISIGVGGGLWLTKWDGADCTDIEGTKGGLSDAFKRAAVKWGIGRYLYNLDEGWADVVADKTPGSHYARTNIAKKGQPDEWVSFYWLPPTLPDWALPDEEQGKQPPQHQVKQAPPKSNGSGPELWKMKCPECGHTGAIIKGQEQYGGGYVCFKKKQGCGAKWATLDALTGKTEPVDAEAEKKKFWAWCQKEKIHKTDAERAWNAGNNTSDELTAFLNFVIDREMDLTGAIAKLCDEHGDTIRAMEILEAAKLNAEELPV